jgi:hypothetical protein
VITGTRESEAFRKALQRIIKAGLHTHCSDVRTRHMWLSESAEDRAVAAKWCTECPVFQECGAAARARGEQFGVWAGEDMTQGQGKKAGVVDHGITRNVGSKSATLRPQAAQPTVAAESGVLAQAGQG